MLLSVAVLAVGLFSTASSQSCSVTTTSPLNGFCPTGYTLISSACCPTGSVIAATTVSSCVDKTNLNTGRSDCPGMKSYCTNSAYLSLMRDQCPLTCGYCSGTVVTTTVRSCVDLKNPRTGVNECPGMYAYCRNSAYLTLMREQCPRTCGYC